MATVVVTVDCAAASQGRCYTPELVRIAEEFHVPMTWLITVSASEPMSNVMLYHAEYLHRIPSWHEIGLRVDFRSNGNAVTDTRERGALIQEGRDLLKQCHVKPTAFRAADHALLASDLPYLEDIGILVDSSPAPGVTRENGIDWRGIPSHPYRPAYHDLKAPGEAKILLVPMLAQEGRAIYLDGEWDAVEPVLDSHLRDDSVLCLGLRDWANGLANWRKAAQLLREKRCRFVTLTQLVSDWGIE